MVIDLTSNEKSAFIRFVSLYLGSSFILLVVIAWLYYENEQKLVYDLTKSKMQNVASNISSKLIFAHMTDTLFDQKKLSKNPEYSISLYNQTKQRVFGGIKEKLDFQKEIKQYDNSYVLIDNSTYGHLGIYYIAIKENSFLEKISTLKITIAVVFLIIFSIIAIVGFNLARLFIAPIKEQRVKMNNFIKDTTHELNTPVTGLILCAENEQFYTEKNMQRIKISAQRISEIYKDLTYLFLQEHKDNKTIVPLDIKSVLEEQIDYFEPLASKKKVNITSEIEAFSFAIDKESLIRLINNLISNAIKYNKMEGSIHITLKNSTLCIEDSGIGIEEAKIKDIFKRYFRATSLQGGFGIGLSIITHICKDYNIEISVDSKINIGTKFTLKF